MDMCELNVLITLNCFNIYNNITYLRDFRSISGTDFDIKIESFVIYSKNHVSYSMKPLLKFFIIFE